MWGEERTKLQLYHDEENSNRQSIAKKSFQKDTMSIAKRFSPKVMSKNVTVARSQKRYRSPSIAKSAANTSNYPIRYRYSPCDIPDKVQHLNPVIRTSTRPIVGNTESEPQLIRRYSKTSLWRRNFMSHETLLDLWSITSVEMKITVKKSETGVSNCYQSPLKHPHVNFKYRSST